MAHPGPPDSDRSLGLTHPELLTARGPIPSRDYLDPISYLRRALPPLPPPPRYCPVDTTLHSPHPLPGIRARIGRWARRAGHPPDPVTDLVLAVHEVVTNALIHGAPPVRVRGWSRPGELLVQVDDTGQQPVPVLAGYQRPDPHTRGGRGLWLARHTADLTIDHSAAGTSVRMHVPNPR